MPRPSSLPPAGPIRRPRRLLLAASALALSVALVPLLPEGDGDRGAIAPSGGPSNAVPGRVANDLVAGTGSLTPRMQAEIERVVSTGTTSARRSAKVAPEQLAADAVKCATFEGQRYCLGTGWTTETPAQVQARVASSARSVASRSARGSGPESTGDLDAAALGRRLASMRPAARASAERQELTEAARSVAKVVLLRHQIQGAPLPAGFLARHPEVRVSPTPGAAPASAGVSARTTTTATARRETAADYPARAMVLSPRRVAEQTTTYWCGPTSMQMIAWGWNGTAQSQSYWARRLGTTRQGTAISDMVRVTNAATGWDNANRAGTYVTLSIADWTFREWMLLQMRHVAKYRAPVILHPVLRKEFFPYLDDDASGHFQVGRGYRTGSGRVKLGYFEPWNQQRFDPSEPYLHRVQWRQAYRSYRANKAHYQQNIGV